MAVLQGFSDLLVSEKVTYDGVGRHVFPNDPRPFSFHFGNRLHVTDQPESRSAFRFVELSLPEELNAREQGLVDNELTARPGNVAGVEINRRFLSSRHAGHPRAELGDRPLFPRGDDLAKLAGLDQSGLADVAIVDAAFFDVLPNILDCNHGAMIVLLDVQYTDLFPSELNQALGDVRDGIKRANKDPVDERDIRLGERIVSNSIRLEASIRDPEKQVASFIVGQPRDSTERFRETLFGLHAEVCFAFGAIGFAGGQSPRTGLANKHGPEYLQIDRRGCWWGLGLGVVPGGQECIEFFRWGFLD